MSEVLPLEGCPELSENPRLGFDSKVALQRLGLSWAKLNNTLGMCVTLVENCGGSRVQTWNRYAYVANNPTGAIDPLGLDPRTCFQDGSCFKSYGQGVQWAHQGGVNQGPASSWGVPDDLQLLTIATSNATTKYDGAKCLLCSPFVVTDVQNPFTYPQNPVPQNPFTPLVKNSPSSSQSQGQSPNSGAQQPQQPQHFWQKPGCGAAIGQTAIGVGGLAIEGAAIYFTGGAALTLAAESATEGILGASDGVHILAGVGTLTVAPAIMTYHGFVGIFDNCFQGTK